MVGAMPSTNGRLMQFPGVFLVLRKQEPTGPSAGSVINHFGVLVKNLDDWRPKWVAAGLKIQTNKNPSLRQLFLYSSDEVKVEIVEDTSISNPVQMHHIHLFVPDPAEAQSWYVKVFGATPASRTTPNGNYETASIPGVEFTFTKSAAQTPSRGRAIDDIGIEIRNLDGFARELVASGIEIEAPIKANATDPRLRVTHITDPWGTRFELTDGFPGNLAYRIDRQLLLPLNFVPTAAVWGGLRTRN
jgi:catechol 2,3-dioxygenase-like lactoylglutathione lyase family enzyme